MANTIKHKRGSGSNPSASDLVAGEIAVRTDTGVLFTKKDDGSVAQISGGGGTNLGVTTATGSVTVTSDTGTNATISEATGSAAGVMSTAHHDKLDGIEANATADQTASEIRSLVESASDSNVFTDADHTKLNGIEANATADQTNAEIKTAYEANSNTNAFTDALLSKLNGIAASATNVTNNNQLTNGAGYITATLTNEQVQDIVGAMLSGNTESGITVTYQDSDGTIDFSVASQTDNNFTTTLKNKLDGIESGATADQSASEILTLLKTVDGAGSGLDADTLDGHSSGAYLRTNLAGTASQDITFSGGAGAATIAGNSDIRFNNGNWTGNSTKIQHHGNWLYIQGGSNGIVLRGPTSDRAYVDSSGNFKPAVNNSFDLGTSSNQWRDGYFDGTVNADGLDIDGNGDISGTLTLHGNLDLQDSDKILLGSGDDLQIYHDGSNSAINEVGTGNLYIQGSSNILIRDYDTSENHILMTKNGGVELYYDGTKKFDTVSGGARIYGYLSMQGSGGHIYLPDSAQLKIGSGEDLEIYHDATDSFVENNTGDLVVVNQANDKDINLQTDNGSGGTTNYLRCDGSDGSVRAYYYGTQKIQTKSYGLDVAGNILLTQSNATITFNSGGPNINCPAANTLDFLTSGTDRMRITPSGDVRIRTFSPRIGASISSVSNNFSAYFAASGTGGGNLPMIVERYNDNGVCIEFKRNTSVVGNINVTPTTTNYVTSSDYRLKENVVDLDDAITRVKQLAPKRFNFTVEPDVTVDGFLAHEAQTVVPEAVTGTQDEVQVWDANDEANGDLPEGVSVGDNRLDEDGNTIPVYQGIDQAKLVPLLTAALQEAITKIETLEAKVAALESA